MSSQSASASAQSLCCVWVFVTPWTVAHQAPLSMGILQARILKWIAMPSSRASSRPRNRTGKFFTTSATGEADLNSELSWNHSFPWVVIFQLDIQLGVFVPLFFHFMVWPQYVWKAPWGFQGAALGWEALTGCLLSLPSPIPKLLLSNFHFWLENCEDNNDNNVAFLWTPPMQLWIESEDKRSPSMC